MLNTFDRFVTADFFRIVPMPFIMNGLHLSGLAGLRPRSAFRGMAVAVALAVAVGFTTWMLTFFYFGSNNLPWNWLSQTHYSAAKPQVARAANWEKRLQEEAKTGVAIPKEQIPAEAKVNTGRIFGVATGATVLGLITFLRRFFLWFPHPVGFVLWLTGETMTKVWFSFFLAWVAKSAIARFGGTGAYLQARNFFLGMVLGEALAASLNILISLLLTLVSERVELFGIQIWLG
jgi:hypothetical protein